MLSSAAMQDLPPDLKSLFGARLRALREEKGWTAEEAAAIIGLVDKSYLCRIERGEKGISLEMLSRLAEVFGVEERTFFTFPGTTIAADIDELLRPLSKAQLHRIKSLVVQAIADERIASKRKRSTR